MDAVSGVGFLITGISKPEVIIKKCNSNNYGRYLRYLWLNCCSNSKSKYSLYSGWRHLSNVLCCGLSSLGTGVAIGIAGNTGVCSF